MSTPQMLGASIMDGKNSSDTPTRQTAFFVLLLHKVIHAKENEFFKAWDDII